MARRSAHLDPQRLRNERGELWLNVASSVGVLPGFANLDNSVFLLLQPVYPLLRPLLREGHRQLFEAYREGRRRALVLRHDCRRPLPLPDGSADHVLCSHFLEHVHAQDATVILRDFHRVLKPSGTLHVIVPDLEFYLDRYGKDRGRPEAADELMRGLLLRKEGEPSLRFRLLDLLGGFGFEHRWMYDAASMRARVEDAGFRLLERNETPSAHYRLDDEESLHVVGQRT